VVTLKYLQALQAEVTELKRAASVDNSENDSSDGNTSNRSNRNAKTGNSSVPAKRPTAAATAPAKDKPPVKRAKRTNNDKVVTGGGFLNDIAEEINRFLPTASVHFHEFDQTPAKSSKFSPVATVLRRTDDNIFSIIRTSTGSAGDKNTSEIALSFPTHERAMQCFQAFNFFLGTCFYFVNPGRFRHALEQTYELPKGGERQLETEHVLFYGCFLLIMAIGEMYLVDRSGLALGSAFPGYSYFEQVGPLVDVAFEGIKSGVCVVDTVQTLLLYAFYYQIIDSSSGHYLIAGVAIRTALVLKMNKEHGKDVKHLSRSELEHRRRLWWTLYVVDRYCCAKMGFPLSISDESITTELPADLPAKDSFQNDPDNVDEFPDADYLVSFIKISQISSSIVTNLYHNKQQADLIPVMLELLSEIDAWRHNLPDSLKVNYQKKGILDTTRTIVSIHSKYFQCINITIRPILLYFVRQRLHTLRTKKSPLNLSTFSKDIISLLTASLKASLQTIRSHSVLSRRDEVAKYGYLDREYIYSAISTLVLFNAAFGVNISASQQINEGLWLLTGMERVGNKNARRRKEQILNLIKTFEENGIGAHDFYALTSNGSLVDVTSNVSSSIDGGSDSVAIVEDESPNPISKSINSVANNEEIPAPSLAAAENNLDTPALAAANGASDSVAAAATAVVTSNTDNFLLFEQNGHDLFQTEITGLNELNFLETAFNASPTNNTTGSSLGETPKNPTSSTDATVTVAAVASVPDPYSLEWEVNLWNELSTQPVFWFDHGQ
jgi:proline utilization trans-activator